MLILLHFDTCLGVETSKQNFTFCTISLTGYYTISRETPPEWFHNKFKVWNWMSFLEKLWNQIGMYEIKSDFRNDPTLTMWVSDLQKMNYSSATQWNAEAICTNTCSIHLHT